MRPARPDATGAFTTAHYPPGRYLLAATAPPGWSVGSALLNGRDVLDAAFELGSDDLDGVVVTYVNGIASLSGTVRSGAGTPATDAQVVVLPLDYQTWIANGMPARRTAIVLADEQGAFRVPNIPPGEYLVVALTPDTEADLSNPAVVSALAGVATRATVPPAGTATATLTMNRLR
jgi:hypothetical protein